MPVNDGDPFQFLQAWYESQCDGDWEHEYGIRLGTLDNPGWWFEIDLTGTAFERKLLPKSKTEPGLGRWIWSESDGRQYACSCDKSSLNLALELFQKFVETRPEED
ncbi:Imm53 family immunity protein [Amycolatopsis sp. NPDC059657]|uniref:Imm53 family immunity protein n=1 Tax=Amycolatopsis sp. NPDC059657 TaxID=3346899 RepID=UPI00366C8068